MLERKKIGTGTHGWAVYHDDVLVAKDLTPLQAKSYVEDLSLRAHLQRSFINVTERMLPHVLEELRYVRKDAYDADERKLATSLLRKIREQAPGMVEMSKEEARLFSQTFPDSGASMIGEKGRERLPGPEGQSYSIPIEVRKALKSRPPLMGLGRLGYQVDPALIDKATWAEIAKLETSEWPEEKKPLTRDYLIDTIGERYWVSRPPELK